MLSQAKAALVTSGTATLETALFGVPEVVCYKGSYISYQIGKRLVKVKYISLVNLIMDKLVVKELIQDDMTVENLKQELQELLTNEDRKAELQNDYAALKKILSEGGNASAKAANLLFIFLVSKQLRSNNKRKSKLSVIFKAVMPGCYYFTAFTMTEGIITKRLYNFEHLLLKHS